MTIHRRALPLLSLLSAGMLGLLACADDDGGGSGAAGAGAAGAGAAGAGATTTSSGGSTASGGSGATAGSGTGASGGGSANGCPLTGTWTISAVACGTFDITAIFFDVMTSGTMTVTDRPGGGCQWTVVNVSDSCTESESYETTDPIPGTISLTSHGIQSCDPAGCAFNADDDACELGARAGTVTAVITIDGGSFTSTGPQGPCGNFGMDTTVTWIPVE